MSKGVYPRGRKLWIRYTDASGERQWKPADLEVGQEERAAQLLSVIKRRVTAERELLKGVDEGGDVPLPKAGVTIAMAWNAWVRTRLKNPKKVKAAKANIWQGRDHVIPLTGHYLVSEFKPLPHALEFAEALQRGRDLAPRSVRTIWSALHTFFKWAVIRGLALSNPCVVEQGVLPKRADKDPNWRRTAVFQRSEVEQIISDERVTLRDRVVCAILFLAGLRHGEVSALRWRYWETTWEPLGMLDIHVAWDSEERVEGPTKTGKQRLIPVHPTLSKLLAEWRLSGFERFTGRKPGPDELIVPTTDRPEHYLQNERIRKILHRAMAQLGLRHRRSYDARRSFVSLCAGARIPKDIFRWWAWGPEGDVPDLYTEVSSQWEAHCEEMAKVRVELKRGMLMKMAVGIAPERDNGWDSRTESNDNAPEPLGIIVPNSMGPSGFEAAEIAPQTQARQSKSAELLGVRVLPDPTPLPHSGVAVPLSHLDRRRIAIKLQAALTAWTEGESNTALRARLTRLMEAL